MLADAWGVRDADGKLVDVRTSPYSVQEQARLVLEHEGCYVVRLFEGEQLMSGGYQLRLADDMEVTHEQQFWTGTVQITLKRKRPR